MAQLLRSNDPKGLNIFDLPELLEIIFSYLAKDKSLYPTLLVNRLWYHCSAPILWRRIEFFTEKDYQRGRRGRKMPRVLTRQLINFKKVMCGKIGSETHYTVIKPTYCAKMIYLRL